MRQPFCPIDIIYKPIKKSDDKINCYFSEKLNIAFCANFNEGSKIKHCSAWQCYFCSNYYARKKKFDYHFEKCTSCPDYINNFNTQSLLTFEENLKYKGDIPSVAYIDFETTARTSECLEPENRKMFAVLYVMVFAFHPDHQGIDCVITERSFGNAREELTILNYLTSEQLDFKDNETLLHSLLLTYF